MSGNSVLEILIENYVYVHNAGIGEYNKITTQTKIPKMIALSRK